MKGENSRLCSLAAVLIWGPQHQRRWANFSSGNNNKFSKHFPNIANIYGVLPQKSIGALKLTSILQN